MKHAAFFGMPANSRMLEALMFLLGVGGSNLCLADARQDKVGGTKNLSVLRLSSDKLFAENQDVLSEKGRSEIRNMIKRNPTLILNPMIITGHSDRLGSHESNQRLSFRRAEAVRRYIKAQGHFVRMDVEGLAETKPLVS